MNYQSLGNALEAAGHRLERYGLYCTICFSFYLFQCFPLGASAAEDPGLPGPVAVTSREYGSFNQSISLPGFPGRVEVLAKVWHPVNMVAKYPLVIFLHGRHAICFNADGIGPLAFPCPRGYQDIPSYRGYDYLAQSLASSGFIVVSISANGVNARDNEVADDGALARARLIQAHLDLWRSFNAGDGPFGDLFRGHVDLARVGILGHSRGGEGAVRSYLHNASLGSPYGIQAVFPLAPTNLNGLSINQVPLAVLLPYCDGDVSDLQGIKYYDDSRYNITSDSAPKHLILVMGANHNFYNTVWTPSLFGAGASDDWLSLARANLDPHCGSFGPGRRLTPAQQQGTALAYVKAFFLTHLGNRTDLRVYLDGDSVPPPSAQTSQVHVSYHAKASDRLDINRLLARGNLTTNTLGAEVGRSHLAPYSLCGGPAPEPPHCLVGQPAPREPEARDVSSKGLSQLEVGWSSTDAQYYNQIPATKGNITRYTRLQFRAGVNFADPHNRLSAQDLTVSLVDAAHRQASAQVSAYSQALFYPPGDRNLTITEEGHTLSNPVPKVTLNMVCIPLSAFIGIDKTNIRFVVFDFDRSASGALLISDIAFAQ